MAGIFTAKALVKRGAAVALVDATGPMTGTSCLSTEGFRTAWPTVGQAALVASSLDELGEDAQLHQNGYLFVTRRAEAQVDPCSVFPDLGRAGGGVRFHLDAAAAATRPGGDRPRGVDVFVGGQAVAAAFPWLDPSVTAAVWYRRAGWMPAHTVGMDALDATVEAAAERDALRLVRARVTGIDASAAGGVRSVSVRSASGVDDVLHTRAVVNAAGPAANAVHATIRLDGSDSLAQAAQSPAGGGVRPGDLPLFSQVHAKGIVRDSLASIPRDAPLTITMDEEPLRWDWESHPEEPDRHAEAGIASELQAELTGRLNDRAPLITGSLPGAAHFRPYGPDALLVLWEHHHSEVEPMRFPPRCPVEAGMVDTESYAETVLRRLARDIPALAAYIEPGSPPGRRAISAAGQGASASQRRFAVDGGYYTRTPDNVPLVGPGPVPQPNEAAASTELDAAERLARGEVPAAFCREVEQLPGYILAAGLSGYGIMAGATVGRLAAAWASADVPCGRRDIPEAALAAAAPSVPGVDSAASMVPPGRMDWVLGGMMHPMRFNNAEWRDTALPAMLAAGGGQL